MPNSSAIKKTRLSLFLIILSRLIIYLIGFSLCISSIIFFSKGHIYNNSFILIVSSALSILVIGWQLHGSCKISELLFSLIVSVAIVGLSTFVITKLYDKSWDGLTYHQMAILELADGWNPFYEQLPDVSMESKYTGRTENMNLYINHYGKGSEIFAAIVMGATGSIESGKVFNVLLMLSALGSALYLLNRLNFYNSFWNFIIATAAAVNPIAVNQIFSYHVDGALGSLLLLLVCNCALLLVPEEKNRSSIYVTIFFLAILLVNLKFTGAVYLAWISLGFVFLNLYLGKSKVIREFLIITGISGAVAVFLVGFNPYVLNTFNFGHPLYPIAGENKVDVISRVMPHEFETQNALQKFVKSTFSACDNFDSVRKRSIEYKLPFTFSAPEIKTFQGEATRLCGFGILWSGIFCLTILCGIFLIKQLSGRYLLYFVVMVFVILLSVLTNPESWWARFVPQLWLFPAIVSVFMLLNQNKIQQLIAKAILFLLIINSSIIAAAYTYSAYANTVMANISLHNMKNSKGPVFVYFDIFTPHAKKFEHENIAFVRVLSEADLPCENKTSFFKIKLCMPEKK